MKDSVAEGVVEHGEAFAVWARHVWGNYLPPARPEILEKFVQYYRGAYDSVADYGKELWDDFNSLPSSLMDYVSVDYVRFAEDYHKDGAVQWFEGMDGRIYVFDVD
jgi:hypothetical protein